MGSNLPHHIGCNRWVDYCPVARLNLQTDAKIETLSDFISNSCEEACLKPFKNRAFTREMLLVLIETKNSNNFFNLSNTV